MILLQKNKPFFLPFPNLRTYQFPEENCNKGSICLASGERISHIYFPNLYGGAICLRKSSPTRGGGSRGQGSLSAWPRPPWEPPFGGSHTTPESFHASSRPPGGNKLMIFCGCRAESLFSFLSLTCSASLRMTQEEGAAGKVLLPINL